MEQQEKKIRVLILIDCQQDFISGSLANEAAQKCIPDIVKKIKEFDGDAIFLTMDTHGEDYLDTPEGKKLPVKHCIKDTDGWYINKEIADAVSENTQRTSCMVRHIMKPTFASVVDIGYDWKSLVGHVLDLEKGHSHPIPMEIEICGFVTSICVVSNALVLKGFTYDFAEITVDSSCCADIAPEKHEAALEVMRSCQINVK